MSPTIASVEHEQPAAAEPLERAEGDQLGHVLAEPHSAEPIRKITIAH